MQRSQTETDAAEARRQRENEAAAAAAKEAATLAATRAREDRMRADRTALDAQNAVLQRIQVGPSSSVPVRSSSRLPDSDGNIIPNDGADEEDDGGRDDASIASISSFGDEMLVPAAQRSVRAPILLSRPLPPQRSLAVIDASLLFGNHQHAGAASSSSSAMGPASFVDLTIGVMPRSRAPQEAPPETQPGE